MGPRFGLAYSIDCRNSAARRSPLLLLPKTVQGNGDGAVEARMRQNRSPPYPICRVTPKWSQQFQLTRNFAPLKRLAMHRDVWAPASDATHDYRNGYAQTWSFGIQRELPFKLLLDVQIIGQRGNGKTSHHLEYKSIPNQYLALGSKLNDKVTDPFYDLIATGAFQGAHHFAAALLQPLSAISRAIAESAGFRVERKLERITQTRSVERRLEPISTFWLRIRVLKQLTMFAPGFRTTDQAIVIAIYDQFVLSGVSAGSSNMDDLVTEPI